MISGGYHAFYDIGSRSLSLSSAIDHSLLLLIYSWLHILGLSGGLFLPDWLGHCVINDLLCSVVFNGLLSSVLVFEGIRNSEKA